MKLVSAYTDLVSALASRNPNPTEDIVKNIQTLIINMHHHLNHLRFFQVDTLQLTLFVLGKA